MRSAQRHLLSIRTFRETLFNYFEWHAIEEVGELDSATGKFYSYVWEGSSQLEEVDSNQINAEFETTGKLNLTTFAQKRQVNLDLMKILFFRFCGARNIHGRAETAPNGDYLVIPDVALAGDFVRQLDAFMQQVILADSTHTEKKVGE